MPCFERLARKLSIEMADDPHDKKLRLAYYAGMDRARLEMAIMAAAIAVLVCLLS